jgi:alkylated DNA nucleotide flippase Atl1
MYRRRLGKMSDAVSVERVIAVSRLVPNGAWTTYAEVGEIVYGHRHGGQSVGNAMRAAGHPDSAHRTLQTGGKVSPQWRGDGGGPEECRRRLRNEGVWDDRRGCARADRFVNADALRRLGA